MFQNLAFFISFSMLSFAVALSSQAQSLDLFPYAFVDDRVQCSHFSDEVSPAQQAVIDEVMASHQHRLSHFLWHTTRNGWTSLSWEEQVAIQRLSPEWGRSAPLCPQPGREMGAYNPAGEVFLRMHHEMIARLRGALVARGLPCISGWQRIPQGDDPLWPMPPGLPGDSSKSEAVGRLIEVWAETLKNPNYLRGRSLSEIGFLIEFSIHNNMHTRWAAIPRAGDDFSPMMGGAFTVHNMRQPSVFDSPEFNWLGNPYSSQVNPVFWKLHGWIDDVITAWLHANSMMYISSQCRPGDSLCYSWQSAWLGGGHQHGDRHADPVGGSGTDQHPARDQVLEQALESLARSSSFRNSRFDEFLKEPRGGSGHHGGVSGRYDDPAVFVENFGPCGAR